LANDKRIAYLPGPSGDRALSARLLRGEERAMVELYEIHAPRLLRLLSRFMSDSALADDALQETFISAFQSLSKLRGVDNLRAWLARIAVRKALNQLRSSSRRTRAESQERTAGQAPPDPDTRDLAWRMLALMRQLDPEKRLVLLLVTEGYSASEIADMTDEPRSTVLSRISRARIELARLASAAGVVLRRQKEEPGP
jgi:RNA polymerase sigma-70 factor (ECF subfamily)